jgi:hypothetical protein
MQQGGYGFQPSQGSAQATLRCGPSTLPTTAKNVIHSPEGMQMSEAANLFSKLWLVIGKIALVPIQNDTTSALGRPGIVTRRFSNLGHEFIGDTDVICIAQIVL